MKTSRQSVMRGLIMRRGWKKGAELGVWQAQLSEVLLGDIPHLSLLCVDRWEPVGAYKGKDMEHARFIAVKKLAPFGDRAWIIQEDTVLAAAMIEDASLDFVFVDASHDTESVAADIRAWRGKIKPTGALTGHDCNLDTVRAALDAELPGWKELGAHVWIWEK